jgi:hypothetical protein
MEIKPSGLYNNLDPLLCAKDFILGYIAYPLPSPSRSLIPLESKHAMSTSQTMLPHTPFLIPLRSKCAMSRGDISQTMLPHVLDLDTIGKPSMSRDHALRWFDNV